jgi:hypothetical protein
MGFGVRSARSQNGNAGVSLRVPRASPETVYVHAAAGTRVRRSAERHTSAWLFGVLKAERRPSPGGDGSEREESRFRPQSGPGEGTERESQTVGRQVDILH